MKNWKLYYPDGRIVENKPPDNSNTKQRIIEANGNKVELKIGSYNGIQGTKIEDDLGRFIFIMQDGDNTKIYRIGVNGEALETTVQWKYKWVYRKYKTVAADSPVSRHTKENLL